MKKKVKFHIQQVWLTRVKEDSTSSFSYKADEIVDSLKDYRTFLMQKFSIETVEFTYSEIPDEIQNQ